MCTDFPKDVKWMNTMYAVSLFNHLRVVADAFFPLRLISATEHLRGDLHKNEVVIITSTLLVVKAKNIYPNSIKMHKTMETEFSH